MSGIDIVLIIIGAALVIISYVISEKASSYKNSIRDREIWSNKDEMTIKDRISIVLADKSEQVIDDTEDKLCHLSNEKIMEFQEFANQLFEKLDENHNQSVFLYKMLNEKQTDMKEWISELDARYADIKDELVKAEEYINNMVKQLPKTAPKKPVENKPAVNKQIENKVVNPAAVPKVNAKEIKSENNKKEPVQQKKNVIESKQKQETAPMTDRTAGNSKKGKNEKILQLFDSGKSILEISKQLGMGQGEVKLIVDLYRGKKK